MKFGFEQRWTSTPQQVVDLYTSEDFWRSMGDLARTSPPEVLEVTRSGDSAVTRVRFRLSVDLPREASRFINPDNVSWVEHSEWNLSAATAHVRFEPAQGAALMKASADVAVLADGSDALRQVKGELRVRIPLLGSRVEKAIVEGIGENLEAEAEVAATHLES